MLHAGKAAFADLTAAFTSSSLESGILDAAYSFKDVMEAEETDFARRRIDRLDEEWSSDARLVLSTNEVKDFTFLRSFGSFRCQHLFRLGGSE